MPQIVRCSILPIADLAAIAKNLVAGFGHLYPDWSVTDAVRELLQDEGSGLPLHVAALNSGLPIAIASIIPDDEVTGWAGKEWWIANVYVMPRYRALGIATQLINYAVDVAKNYGAKELHLVTDSAEPWYAKHGWTNVGSGDVHGHSMAVMRLDLGRIS